MIILSLMSYHCCCRARTGSFSLSLECACASVCLCVNAVCECAHIAAQNCAPVFSSQLNFETTTKRLIIRERNAQCHLHCQRRLRLQAKCVCYCGRILHYKNDTIFKPRYPHSFRSYFSFFMPFYAKSTDW